MLRYGIDDLRLSSKTTSASSSSSESPPPPSPWPSCAAAGSPGRVWPWSLWACVSPTWLSQYVDLPSADRLAAGHGGPRGRGGREPGSGLAAWWRRACSRRPHPNAEKLSVTRVDGGAASRSRSSVAPRITRWATWYRWRRWAPPAGGARIEKAKLRGVESCGMLCSAKELGVDDDTSGLLLLPTPPRPGLPIARALGLDDVLLEVERHAQPTRRALAPGHRP